MTSKIQEEIKDLEKELKKYYPHTPEANIIRYKISQTKKCIEMFREMIDKSLENVARKLGERGAEKVKTAEEIEKIAIVGNGILTLIELELKSQLGGGERKYE